MARKVIGIARNVAGPRGSRRRRWTALFTLVIAVSGGLFLMQNVLAVHDLEFELDGDVTANNNPNVFPVEGDIDWSSIFDANGGTISPLPSTSFKHARFVADFATVTKGQVTVFAANDPTTYATGSKDILGITPGWQCTQSNNVNSKDDIMNAYAAQYEDPVTGEEILYFGLERNANTGDANIGFWFLQDDVDCVSAGGTTAFSGHHTDGDIFIVSAFTKGGDVSTITAYRWTCQDANMDPLEGQACDDAGAAIFKNSTEVGSGVDCRNANVTAGDTACAAANRVVLTGATGTPWLTSNKDDNVGHSLQIGEFFEGGLNLTATGLGGKCFNTFVGNTRSSQELTATIFDYARGLLGECVPELKTDVDGVAPNGIISPGVQVRDLATITVTGADAPEDATGTVDFFLCFSATAFPDCSTGGTDAGTNVALVDISNPGNTTDGISGAFSNFVNTAANPLAPGFYCFGAVADTTNYDPDPAAYTDLTNECFRVRDTSAITTEQLWRPNDRATVVKGAGGAASGTVVFSLYPSNNCTGTPVTFGPITLDADGKALTNNLDNIMTVGTTNISWRVVFTSTDPNVLGSTSNCERSVLTIDNIGIP